MGWVKGQVGWVGGAGWVGSWFARYFLMYLMLYNNYTCTYFNVFSCICGNQFPHFPIAGSSIFLPRAIWLVCGAKLLLFPFLCILHASCHACKTETREDIHLLFIVCWEL